MPRPVNNLQLSGTLTRDPQVTILDKNGKPLKIVKFTLAFDWWHGKKLKPAWFFDCVSFGYSAEAAEKYLQKGKRILVTSSYIEPRVYEGKDGTKRKAWSIIVDDFIMIGYNDKTEGQSIDEVMQEITEEEEIPC